MDYRKDIDGLRALAVLMVVFYHLGFDWIPGGFVGVDVFFVISGFLITGIIYKGISTNEFSIIEFYIRRARRILPALYTMLIIVLIFGAIFFLPRDYFNLAKTTISAALFYSNILFWNMFGEYFALNSQEQPLLHTWSLSVEWQFYFLWPFFLLSILRFLKVNFIKPMMFSLIIICVVISQYGALKYPSAAYFLLPTRAGELIIGGLGYFLMPSASRMKPLICNVFSIIGVLLIIVSSLVLTKHSAFPGFNALLPCLGALLIILSTENGVVNKLISIKPIVFIGLISYSLYLWHWPIIAVFNYYDVEISNVIAVMIFSASLLLAVLSWRFVERPTSRIKVNNNFSRAVLYFIGPATFTILLCSIVLLTNGFGFRYDNNKNYIKSLTSRDFPILANGWCYGIAPAADAELVTDKNMDCHKTNKNGTIKVLLWGDSHAGYYEPFFYDLLSNDDVKISPVSVAGCFPSINISGDGNNPKVCMKSREVVKKRLIHGDYDIVIISGRWDDNISKLKDIEDAIEFASYHAKKVIVMAQVPLWNGNAADKYIKKESLPLYHYVSSTPIDISPKYKRANYEIQSITKKYRNAFYFNLEDLFVLNQKISPYDADGFPIYKDEDHLNLYGSRYLAEKYKGTAAGLNLIKVVNGF